MATVGGCLYASNTVCSCREIDIHGCCGNVYGSIDHVWVLDVMDIADLEISNLLVDLCHIDTVLLIERRLDAEKVIEVERPRGTIMVSGRRGKGH